MTTVIFIRHGQSDCNLTRHFAGQIDAKLTDLGRAQAQSAAKALQKFPITRIYASPLSRATNTAKPTAELLGLEITPEPGLCEIAAGAWEGLAYEEIAEKYGISPFTVKRHIQNILDKTGYENRLELAVNAKAIGLVVHEDDRTENRAGSPSSVT